MNKWIEIGDPILKGNRIENEITSSEDMQKYLKYSTFYAEYDEEIEWNPRILNIPAVSCLITLAWLTDSELRVGEIDPRFILSMEELHREYKKMYPGVLGGKLTVKRIEPMNPMEEEIPQKPISIFQRIRDLLKRIIHITPKEQSDLKKSGLALFFSGGLDSTYSLYQLKERGPRLIMVGGFDVYMDRPRDEAIWKKWKTIYGEYAEREGLTINFIRTNSRACIKEGQVNLTYRNKLKLAFWDALRHAPLLIGLAAPLSVGRFNELVISASRTPEQPTTLLPYSSAPNTDEKVAWADLKVTHYGQIHRYEKVNALLEPLREGKIIFKTCYKLCLNLNCSICEKCGRVITFLLAEGIDPNTCGFTVNDDTLKEIRKGFEKFIKWNYRMQIHWLPWIKDLPDEVPDLYGIREFVEWMRDFEYQGVKL